MARRQESDIFVIDLRKGNLIFEACFLNEILVPSPRSEIYQNLIDFWSGAQGVILLLILN